MTPIPVLGGGSPLLGHARALAADPLAFTLALPAAVGDLGAFRVGPRRVVMSRRPEDARTVLIERAADFEKGPTVRRFARPVLGEGIIAAANADHRRKRKLVAAAFTPKRLREHAEVIREEAERAVASWGPRVDLAGELTRLTLRIVGRCLFDVDLEGSAAALGRAVNLALEFVTERISRPFAPPLWFPGSKRRAVREALHTLDRAIAALIEDRRREGPGRDVVSDLVFAREDGDALADQEIRDELMNLLVAGHETTAHGLAFTLAELAAAGTELEPTAVARSAAFEEGMRLFPPVHSLGRVATARVGLGEYAVDPGAVVVISTLLLHRHPALFPRAAEFVPGRFLDRAAIPKDVYLPFGAGPRACIGAQLAMMEAELVLATILERVVLEAPTRPRARMLVTLRPIDARVAVRRR